MAQKKKTTPTAIQIIGWFGIVLACTYLLWGVVGGVLSILDRTYKDFNQNLIIVFYGLIVMTASIAFKSIQKWGYWGLLLILALVVIWTIFSYTDIYGIIWGIASVIMLVGILSPPVRKHYF